MLNDPAEPNEFDQFQTVGEILGYLYSRAGGVAAIRGLLALDQAELTLMREDLVQAASELERVGLLEAAQAVRKAAKTRPERKYQCSYSPSNPANVKAWVAMQRQRHRGDFDESKIVYPDE